MATEIQPDLTVEDQRDSVAPERTYTSAEVAQLLSAIREDLGSLLWASHRASQLESRIFHRVDEAQQALKCGQGLPAELHVLIHLSPEAETSETSRTM